MPAAFFQSVLDLIVKTSTDLPPDVRAAMKVAMEKEEEGNRCVRRVGDAIDSTDECVDTSAIFVMDLSRLLRLGKSVQLHRPAG